MFNVRLKRISADGRSHDGYTFLLNRLNMIRVLMRR
jgi:hypothetical protein